MKSLLLFIVIVLTSCTTIDYPEQPSRVEEVTLADGRVVLQYVEGYSIEDFLREFHNPTH